MKYLLLILGVLVVLIALNPGGAFTQEKRPPVVLSETQKADIAAEASRRFQNSLESEMVVKAKRAVSAIVKDPDSVQFRDVRYGNSEKTGPVAYGFLNSKNSFGAYTGFQRFISNGSTSFLEERDSAVVELWSHVAK